MPSCPHCRTEHQPKIKVCPKTGQPMPGITIPGRVFDGKYKVVKHLADGGMGAVFEAEHLVIGKHVAIKVLHPEFAANDDILERFRREARAATSIGHEGIIEIWDMGRSEDGALFIVMELLKGSSLGEVLHKDKRIEAGRAAHIMTQMLSALAAAHQHGIVHRDLKPENVVLITRNGDPDFVKILDFGISKVLSEDQSLKLTSTGFVLGTPYYMAPEQARGGNLDHRVDIYGAGAILYQMVTGRLPFSAPNFNALLFEIAAGRVVPTRQLVPNLPAGFEKVIERAMAIESSQRFQSSAEFAHALAPFVKAPATERTPAPTLTPAHPSQPVIAPAPTPSQPMKTMPLLTPSNPIKPGERTLLQLDLPPGALVPPPQMAAPTPAPLHQSGGTPMAIQLGAGRGGQDGQGRSGAHTAIALGAGTVVGLAAGVLLFFMGGKGGGDQKPRLTMGDMPAVGAKAVDAGVPAAARDAGAGAAIAVDAGAVAVVADAAVAPVEKTVTITLEVTPPEATLTWEGEPLTERVRTVAMGKTKLHVKAELEGYRPKEVSVVPDKDRTIEIKLSKKGSGGGKKGPGSQIDL